MVNDYNETVSFCFLYLRLIFIILVNDRDLKIKYFNYSVLNNVNFIVLNRRYFMVSNDLQIILNRLKLLGWTRFA